MDELYFIKLLDLATDIDNGRVANKIMNGLNYKTLLRLAKQEQMYKKSGIDPSTTQSGCEMLKTLEVIKNRLGEIPSRDVLKKVMTEDRRVVDTNYSKFLESHNTNSNIEPPAEYVFENELSYQEYTNSNCSDITESYTEQYYDIYKQALRDFTKSLKESQISNLNNFEFDINRGFADYLELYRSEEAKKLKTNKSKSKRSNKSEYDNFINWLKNKAKFSKRIKRK